MDTDRQEVFLVDFLPALKSGDSFCKTAKSRRENVFCRIGVAVVYCTAVAASPFSPNGRCAILNRFDFGWVFDHYVEIPATARIFVKTACSEFVF